MLPCRATELAGKKRQGSRDQSLLVRIAAFVDSTAARHPAMNTVSARPPCLPHGLGAQRCVFNSIASRVAPVREAVISVPARSRIRTR